MGLFDWFKKKKELELARVKFIGMLEKKAGNLRMPDTGTMRTYLEIVERWDKEGYDISKYHNTMNLYRTILEPKTKRV